MADGGTDDGAIVLRWVEAPIGFHVEMAIEPSGKVTGLGVFYSDGIRFSDAWAIDRGLIWCLDRLSRGDGQPMACDLIEDLPRADTGVAEIERAILTEIEAVQKLRQNKALGGVL